MHLHQARNKWSRLLRNDRISAVIENITIHFSLFFSQTQHTYLYIYVCVCRENTLLLTGNPGYCNLPRLDSTCLSAVWYRVGHCCNWSRNAIALLIIEIINGPRYRVGSYSKYLDKSRYGGCFEMFSFENIYIYVCACSFVIMERSCLYRAYFHIHFFLRKERRGEQDSSIFFFHHWNLAVVEIRLFKYISFLSVLVIILTWNIDWLIGLPIIWVTFRTKPPPVGQYLRRACSFYPMNLTFRCTIIVLSRRLAVRFKF